MTAASTDRTNDRSPAPPRPPVTPLRESLAGQWADVRRDLATRYAPQDLLSDPALTRTEHRARVADQLQLLAGGTPVLDGFPTSAGGTGDYGASVTAFEMLGHTDLSLMVKAGVQWGLFGGAIANLGTREHHQQYLPDVLSLRLPGCFAMTETGHGSDVQALATTATYDPGTDQIIVHTPTLDARKDYIGGAARDARMAVVFAQLRTGRPARPQQHGVHAVLVPIRSDEGTPLPGVTLSDCGPKLGLNGVDNGRIVFDQVRVPRANLLSRFGRIDPDGSYHSAIDSPNRRFFTMLGTLVRGRISVAGGAGAATRTALTIAVRYAEQRRQFTLPGTTDEVVLLDYRSHQRRLLPALATSYALTYAQNDLVALMHDVQTRWADQDQPDDEARQRRLESLAAGVKVLATEHATRAIQECREACGGAGYLAENRIAALKSDTDVFTTFEGDNTVLLQLVAKGLLTSYSAAFGDLDTLGTLRFVARQVASTVLERTPARALAVRLTEVRLRRRDGGDLSDLSDLADPAVQLRLLSDREQHVLSALARRLRGGTRSEPAAAFTAFNDTQDHALAAARAHVERVVLESFLAAVERCQDEGTRALLADVCTLHVLTGLERDRAWYVEHGRMSTARSKAITSQVNALCARLRPHARTLVDGFGIPDGWLAAALLDPLPNAPE